MKDKTLIKIIQFGCRCVGVAVTIATIVNIRRQMDDYFDDYFEDFEQDVESGQASHKQSAKNITPKASVKDVKRKPAKSKPNC